MLANVLVSLGDRDKARGHYEKGIAIREKAMAAKPGDVDIRIGYGLSLEKYGLFKTENGEIEAGIEMLRKAIREYGDLAKADPGNSEVHLHYIRGLNTMAQARIDEKEVNECLKTAFAIADRFAKRDPGHMVWEREALRQRYNQERTDSRAGTMTPERRLTLAKGQLEFLVEFLAAVRRRDREDPDNYLWRADSANLLGRVGKAHYDLARLGDNVAENLRRAEEYAKSSMAEYETVLERSPKSIDNGQGLLYAAWLYSEVAYEGKNNLEGIRRTYAFVTRETKVFRDLLVKFPDSDYARKEFRRAVSARSSRINTPDIVKFLLAEGKDDAGVIAGYLGLLRIVTDVPANAAEPIREIYTFGQKRLAPFGRVLYESGKLSAEDRRLVESLPKE